MMKDFEFDLQLFGHSGGGKSGGKIIATIAGAAFGWFNPLGFGLAATAHFGGAVLGAALFSSIWTAVEQKNMNFNTGSADVQRFDKAQETMTSNAQLPVVYGYRKITGNQTFHDTNADQNTLHKHVVLCEGGIQGIESVSANELLIPTGGKFENTAFTITNTKYSNAKITISNRNITFSANGNTHTWHLCNKKDLQKGSETYWQWEVAIGSMISHINQLGDGWQAFPTATTSKYPGDIKWPGIEMKPYNSTISAVVDTVTGGTEYTFHDCETPDNYSVVGGYPKMAWLDMTFMVSSELNGNPSVSCIIRGKKVYDARTRLTQYSTNPVWCLRDFLLSEIYGMGKWFSEEDIDNDSWCESADYCDEIITYRDSTGDLVTSKRYELNMIIDNKRNALEWVQEILANFCGYLVYSNGKLKLHIERETPVSYKFTDDNCKDLKISPLKLSETPNRYEVSIVDPLNDWATIKCISEDLADQKKRQKIITKSVSLEGVTNQGQALRLARFYSDYNLVCPLQVSFTTGMQGMHLEPGDVVTVSYHEVFKELPIRIAEIRETDKGTFEISGRQYNESIYGDALGGGIQWHRYGAGGRNGKASETPAQITNVIAYTNTDDEILVEHDPSYEANFAEYRYYMEEMDV